MTNRRPLNREFGQRQYKKLFIIAVEGNKTEHEYFSNLKAIEHVKSIINIKCLKSNHKSSPGQVLKKLLKQFKSETNFRLTDEAWVVVDKDNWHDQQLEQLYKWSCEAENYGFALSNPKFEYWLLLHFEDGNAISTANECYVRLLKHLPDYDKSIDFEKISLEKIHKAIHRAKIRDNPPCSNWPRAIGTTTVYRLVEKILTPSLNE